MIKQNENIGEQMKLFHMEILQKKGQNMKCIDVYDQDNSKYKQEMNQLWGNSFYNSFI